MVNFNKIMVIGNLGRDPEMRYTAQGLPVTSFSIATNRVFTDPSGEKQTETEWFTIITWRQLAELCNQYLSKGRRAFVEGRLHSRTWEGNDGKPHFVNEITADRVLFLDRADRENEGFAPSEGAPPPSDGGAPSEPDDLPF
jgi:single-strand DNA-binding protein